MYKGNGWEILFPKRNPRFYRVNDLNFERVPDPIYRDDIEAKLDTARAKAIEHAQIVGQDLRQAKLIGFGHVKESGEGATVGLRQLDYITFAAATWLADHQMDSYETGSNLGVMSTVTTVDGKSIHSRRRQDLASWGGYDGIFGCGLTGDKNGDPDILVKGGSQMILDIILQRVIAELGLSEVDINDIKITGVVEAPRYGDHIIAFHTLAGVESEKIEKGKAKLLRDTSVGRKYEDIFPIDSEEASLRKYLQEGKILDVARGAIVLTGINSFGEVWGDSVGQRIG